MNIPHKDHPSRGDRRKDHANGRFAGTYTGDGKSLKRTSDGLHLLILDRGETVGPHSSRHYIVNASSPKRDYVSNLYGDQFDDRSFRYQIVERPEETGTFDIVVLYPVKRGRRGRVGQRA